MGGGPFDRTAKREQLFKESIENAGISKFGLFGYTPSLATGDDSLAPRAVRRTEFKRPGLMTNPPKCGQTAESFFSVHTPLCIGDTYVDPLKRTRKKNKPLRDDQIQFKPPGTIIRSTNILGYEYSEQGTGNMPGANGKRKENFALRNIGTGPAKKGGAGLLAPGVLFGFGDERKFPEHVPDDFDAIKKKKRQDWMVSRSKMHELPFKGAGANKMGY